tara:strand:- start:2414 stop:3310 length:897 start_codon:yes stop_codon:yes gene_type:complete
MPKFDISKYETVEERLKKFWADYPNGRIWTEEVFVSDDAKTVIFKAFIYMDKEDINPVSTGIAEETKGQGNTYVNSTSHVENCETSAIGRALANWMYQGSDKARPSLQEMTKTQAYKDDKVEVTKGKSARPTKEQKEQMEKVVDEMVAEPKTPTGKSKKNANQMLHVMKSICSDDKQMKELQATAYAQVVEQDKFMEDVEKWSSDMMTRFLDIFEQLYKETTGSIDNVDKVFDVEGGDDVNWKENPASEKQMKWVNDIVTKATDQEADFLPELKELYGDGNLNGETASQIIDNYSNKV